MSTLATLLEAARASGDYNAVLDALPYARFLGLRAVLDGQTVRAILPFQASLVGNPGLPALHGGVVGAVMEMAALLQVLHVLQGPFPKTVDFSVDYLRAARAEPLFAEAELEKRGRRIANVRMRAFQGDRAQPVALGRGNFLVD